MLRRHRAAVALVAWTFFVWTTRIGNILRDEDLGTGDKVGRTALALSFTVLAIAVVVALVRRAGWSPRVIHALAGWTTLVWVVQGIGILLRDHDIAFKVVHAVLAVVSIGLAWLVWREMAVREREPAGRPG
jgi:hypothetical protein